MERKFKSKFNEEKQIEILKQMPNVTKTLDTMSLLF